MNTAYRSGHDPRHTAVGQVTQKYQITEHGAHRRSHEPLSHFQVGSWQDTSLTLAERRHAGLLFCDISCQQWTYASPLSPAATTPTAHGIGTLWTIYQPNKLDRGGGHTRRSFHLSEASRPRRTTTAGDSEGMLNRTVRPWRVAWSPDATRADSRRPTVEAE